MRYRQPATACPEAERHGHRPRRAQANPNGDPARRDDIRWRTFDRFCRIPVRALIWGKFSTSFIGLRRYSWRLPLNVAHLEKYLPGCETC